MKKTRKELVTASVEITLIFILTAALIIMFAAYCGFKNTARSGDAPSFDFLNNSLQSQISSDENPVGILSPAFIGVVTDKHLAPEDIDTRNRLLKDAVPFLTGAFSDVSTMLEFSSASARLDYINKNLYSAKNYLYINFANDIPAGAIIPCINGKTAQDTPHPFNVKELFVFCSRDGAISGATIDSAGNVSTLTVRDRTPLSFETLRAYEDISGMKKFEFASGYDRKYPVMSSSVARNIAIAYTDSGDFLTAGSSQVRNILSAFGFNPNGTRFYRAGNDSITYVEDGGELRISHDGNVTYTAIDSGSALSSAVGDDSFLSLEDMISKAYSTITHLDSKHFGNAAHLSLSSLYHEKESNRITMSFKYNIGGIDIQNEDIPDAEFVFNKSGLVYSNVNARAFDLLESTYTDIPQKLLFAFSMQNSTPENIPGSFIPVYKQNPETSAYEAKYAFIYSTPSEGDNDEKNEGEAE